MDECAFAGGGRGESANSGKDSARCVVDCERIGGGGSVYPGDKKSPDTSGNLKCMC